MFTSQVFERRRSPRSYLFLLADQTVGIVPPSITISVPVIAEARSDAAKATSSATSSGRLGRPSGIPPSMFMSFCRAAVYFAFVCIGHALNHACGRIGLYETRRHGQDPNSLWTDF